MLVCALVITFFAVVATGPDNAQWISARLADVRSKREERADQPLARVVYLPSAACRAREPECDPAICAICRVRSLRR